MTATGESADQAERKVREWVTRKRNGGGAVSLTPEDAVELALAIDEDAVARDHRAQARHEETVGIVKGLRREFAEHSRTEAERIREIVTANRGLTAQETRTLIAAEVQPRFSEHMRDHHSVPRRRDDPPDEDHRRDRTDGGADEQRAFERALAMFTGTWIGRLVIMGLGAGIGVLVERLLT